MINFSDIVATTPSGEAAWVANHLDSALTLQYYTAATFTINTSGDVAIGSTGPT